MPARIERTPAESSCFRGEETKSQRGSSRSEHADAPRSMSGSGHSCRTVREQRDLRSRSDLFAQSLDGPAELEPATSGVTGRRSNQEHHPHFGESRSTPHGVVVESHGCRARLPRSRRRVSWVSRSTLAESSSTPMDVVLDSRGVVVDSHGCRARLSRSQRRLPWMSCSTPAESSSSLMGVALDSRGVVVDSHGCRARLPRSQRRLPWMSCSTPAESSSTPMDVALDSRGVNDDFHGSRARLPTRRLWKLSGPLWNIRVAPSAPSNLFLKVICERRWAGCKSP